MKKNTEIIEFLINYGLKTYKNNLFGEKSQVKVTDAKLQDFYTKHAEQFQLPEVIKAEFVVLAPDVVESKITVSEADIKTYYEQKFMAKGQKIKYTQFLLDTFDITKGIAFEEAQEAERKRLAKKESE